MDPTETLKLAEQAIDECEFDDAREYLSNYWNWRKSGGFEPKSVGGIMIALMDGDDFANYLSTRVSAYD